MAVAAFKLKPKPKLRTFYATVHVTRVEEWCVEAESEEEARERLASGDGFRTSIGDCVSVEVERVEGYD
jgi:hypothetical protein